MKKRTSNKQSGRKTVPFPFLSFQLFTFFFSILFRTSLCKVLLSFSPLLSFRLFPLQISDVFPPSLFPPTHTHVLLPFLSTHTHTHTFLFFLPLPHSYTKAHTHTHSSFFSFLPSIYTPSLPPSLPLSLISPSLKPSPG